MSVFIAKNFGIKRKTSEMSISVKYERHINQDFPHLKMQNNELTVFDVANVREFSYLMDFFGVLGFY